VAGLQAGKSLLPGGRKHCVIPYGMRFPVAVSIRNCFIPFTLHTLLYWKTEQARKWSECILQFMALRLKAGQFHIGDFDMKNVTSLYCTVRPTTSQPVSVINPHTAAHPIDLLTHVEYIFTHGPVMGRPASQSVSQSLSEDVTGYRGWQFIASRHTGSIYRRCRQHTASTCDLRPFHTVPVHYINSC